MLLQSTLPCGSVLCTTEERNGKNTLAGEHGTSPFERSRIVEDAENGRTAPGHRGAPSPRSPEPIPHAPEFRMPCENHLFEVVQRRRTFSLQRGRAASLQRRCGGPLPNLLL